MPIILERTQWRSAFLQKRMPNCQSVRAPASEEYHTEGNAYWCKAPSYCLKSVYLLQRSRPYRRYRISPSVCTSFMSGNIIPNRTTAIFYQLFFRIARDFAKIFEKGKDCLWIDVGFEKYYHRKQKL